MPCVNCRACFYNEINFFKQKNNYIFKNCVEELKNKLLYVINNYDEFKRKLPNERWQEQYNMERFENAYINVIK